MWALKSQMERLTFRNLDYTVEDEHSGETSGMRSGIKSARPRANFPR